MKLLVRLGGFAESAKQENVVIVRYEGSTTSCILFNYKTFVSAKNMEQKTLLRYRDDRQTTRHCVVALMAAVFERFEDTPAKTSPFTREKLTFKQHQFIGNKLQI
jgi:hypothetical protein